jgi:hypothetical protein
MAFVIMDGEWGIVGVRNHPLSFSIERNKAALKGRFVLNENSHI